MRFGWTNGMYETCSGNYLTIGIRKKEKKCQGISCLSCGWDQDTCTRVTTKSRRHFLVFSLPRPLYFTNVVKFSCGDGCFDIDWFLELFCSIELDCAELSYWDLCQRKFRKTEVGSVPMVNYGCISMFTAYFTSISGIPTVNDNKTVVFICISWDMGWECGQSKKERCKGSRSE